MSFLKKWRRARLARRPFPKPWEPFLSGVPLYPWLSPEEKGELKGHIQVFLAEKRFEGAAGFSVDDRARVIVAGNACLLLLHREIDYFPLMRTVVVYPTLYVARYTRPGPAGTVEEGVEVRAGESWPLGTVVLAWDAVASAGFGPGKRNVVIHEFAHQLDLEDGAMQGVPPLPPHLWEDWRKVFFREYTRVSSALASTPLAYGRGNPAEFFAVAVELFFSDPWSLQSHHPELYALLSRFFRRDTAALVF